MSKIWIVAAGMAFAGCDAGPSKRPVASLLRALDVSVLAVRLDAVKEAEGLAPVDALRVLRAGLRNDEPEVRRACVRALGRMGSKAAEALPDLLAMRDDATSCLDVEEAILKIQGKPQGLRPVPPGKAFAALRR